MSRYASGLVLLTSGVSFLKTWGLWISEHLLLVTTTSGSYTSCNAYVLTKASIHEYKASRLNKQHISFRVVEI
jgi:hypothetical protein